MILDKWSEVIKYQHLIPNIKEILDYCKEHDLEVLKPGRYPILGEDVFLLIKEYETRNYNEVLWEAHKVYIDVQVIIKGNEIIGYSPADKLKICKEYDEENDVLRYEKDGEGSRLHMNQGMYSIFYPMEGHKPNCVFREKGFVKKAVIKIRAK